MSNRRGYSIYINVNWESRTQDLVRPEGQLSRCWKQWRRAEYSISNSIYISSIIMIVIGEDIEET